MSWYVCVAGASSPAQGRGCCGFWSNYPQQQKKWDHGTAANGSMPIPKVLSLHLVPDLPALRFSMRSFFVCFFSPLWISFFYFLTMCKIVWPLPAMSLLYNVYKDFFLFLTKNDYFKIMHGTFLMKAQQKKRPVQLRSLWVYIWVYAVCFSFRCVYSKEWWFSLREAVPPDKHYIGVINTFYYFFKQLHFIWIKYKHFP